MPLDTAIRALNPTYYWHFGDAAGSSIAHDEMGIRDITLTGTDPFHVVGPELGSFAARLWSDTIMLGPNWGVGAWASFTLMLMATVPANATPPAPVDFLGIGDPSNRHARGMWLQHYSLQTDQAQTRIAGSANALPLAISQPVQTWHLWTWTLQLSPALVTFYDNGTSLGTIAATPGIAPQATDRLWLQSANPIVVAHLAWFPRVLSQPEVQTVSNQVLPWPYQQPINLPATWLGGGTDLTPVLTDTQAILQDTAHMDDTTLPAMQTTEQGILQAVTNALQTATGVALSTPVGSLVAHPDPNLLSLSPSPFTLRGRGALDAAPPFHFAGIYGIAWQVTTAPAGAGLLDGVILEYDVRVAQFAMLYLNRTTSSTYVAEVLDTSRDNFLWLWGRYLPHQLLYDITPEFELTCWWFGAY